MRVLTKARVRNESFVFSFFCVETNKDCTFKLKLLENSTFIVLGQDFRDWPGVVNYNVT